MSELKQALSNGRVQITFRKVDGTIREMNATTNDLLVAYTRKSTKVQVKPKSDLITVWDLDKNQWRSFRETSVIDWKAE